MRKRWQATLLLGAMIGLAGATAMTATAAGRRTNSVIDRFIAFSRPAQVLVDGVDFESVRQLPQVEAADIEGYALAAPGLAGGDGPDMEAFGEINPHLAAETGVLYSTMDRPLVLAGRLADPAEALEMSVDEATARRFALTPGVKLRLHFLAAEQLGTFTADEDAGEMPEGPVLALTVTGIVRHQLDITPSDADDVATSDNDAYLTPAFWRAYGDQVAAITFPAYRLRDGAREDFATAVGKLPGGLEATFEDNTDATSAARSDADGFRVQATALWVFAALAALAGAVVCGQALARQARANGENHTMLWALGLTRRQLVAVSTLRGLVPGVVGAVIAVAISALASPIGPIGQARRGEIDPGFALDGPVLVIGALGVVLMVACWSIVLGLWSSRALRGDGTHAVPRAGRLLTELSERGLPAPAVVGVGMALRADSGPQAVPVRTAVAGTLAAVGVMVASVIFAGSLGRLLDSPALMGWNWDVTVGNPNFSEQVDDDMAARLVASPVVEGVSRASFPLELIRLSGRDVASVGVEPIAGSVFPLITQGREPREMNEVALGESTLDRLGLRIGDTTTVEGASGTGDYLIVGRTVYPASLNVDASVGDGAVFTDAGLGALGESDYPRYLVRFAPGVDRHEAFLALQSDHGRVVQRVVRPDTVANLYRVRNLPFMLAGLVGLLGLGAMAHALATSIRRRRRDLAMLKTLGFVRRQVSATAAWQASTLALVALALGLPIGVVGGRWAWRLVVDGLGTPSGPVVPAFGLLAGVIATLVAANLVAALPARAAGRTRPAAVLRAE